MDGSGNASGCEWCGGGRCGTGEGMRAVAGIADVGGIERTPERTLSERERAEMRWEVDCRYFAKEKREVSDGAGCEEGSGGSGGGIALISGIWREIMDTVWDTEQVMVAVYAEYFWRAMRRDARLRGYGNGRLMDGECGHFLRRGKKRCVWRERRSG